MTERRRAILAFCLVLLAGIAAWWLLAQLYREKPAVSHLTEEEALKIAAEVMRGERDAADLKKYGIRIGKPTTGEAARKHLLEELDALGKSRQKAPELPPANQPTTP